MNFFEGRSSILLSKLPLPPSSNNQYFLARRGKKTYHIPSDELKAFQAKMNQYPYSSATQFLIAKQQIKIWIDKGLPLEIRAVFFFKRERIFTKQGKPKRLDVSNRIKASHDSLCKLFEMDDSIFFRVYAEKAECHENLEEMVCVEILPCI